MTRLLQSALLLAGVATAFLSAWLIMRPVPALHGAEPSFEPVEVSLPPSVDKPSAVVPASLAAIASAASRPLSSSPFPLPGLADRVDGWSHSAEPEDAMRAYKAVQRCLRARREDRTPEEEIEKGDEAAEAVIGAQRLQAVRAERHQAARWCQDLRSDQIESRLAWLVRAAAAGTPEAAFAFMLEGPDGQGALDGEAPSPTAPDAWYAQRDAYFALGLAHCDRTLPMVLAVEARSPDASAVEAIAFWNRRLQCGDTTPPAPLPLSDDPLAVEYLRRMGRGLPIVPFKE